MIGPFGYNDARATMSQSGFDWTAWKNKRAADQNLKAAQLSVQDARDLVVQAVASAYLQIIADAARVEATKAQVSTAQALYERARDQHVAGVSPAIDELRAQVELKTQQQALLAQQNQFDQRQAGAGPRDRVAHRAGFHAERVDSVQGRWKESRRSDALRHALETRSRLSERADAGAGRGNGSRRRARPAVSDARRGCQLRRHRRQLREFARELRGDGIAEVQHLGLAEKFAPMSSRPTPPSSSARMSWPIWQGRSIFRFARRCWI